MKVAILGASGMMGSVVLDWFSRDTSLEPIVTVRSPELQQHFASRISGVEWRLLDAERCTEKDIVNVLRGASWAVNAIGVIKPYIHDDNAAEVERAVRVNALFPHLLAQAAKKTGCRVLQIATDCVFSGSKGRYAEADPHDPLDVYGRTKSLGEVYSSQVQHLRCSIIGPEPKGHVSLLDWFLGQSRNAGVNGYTNHQWNGVTTLHFAKLCRGIIANGLELPHVQHVLPTGTISKAEMLGCFARDFHREDVAITSIPARVIIDRTLATVNGTLNRHLWMAAGYPEPPSVPQMIAELAQFDYRFGGGRP